jgi:hypothetical protein
MWGRMRRTKELRSQLFGAMMRRFGVTERLDYGDVEGTKLHTAAARCTHCGEVARCKAWMEQTTGTEGADEFCPNAATFAALSARPRR